MNQTVSEKETPTGTPEAEVDVHVGICPYFKKDRGKGRLNCEGATFRFPTCWRAGSTYIAFAPTPRDTKIVP